MPSSDSFSQVFNMFFFSRINAAIEQSSQVPEEDIRQLKQELVPVFVVCLQQDR